MKMAMFRKIDENKRLGLNKSQVARKLGINPKTVAKYWCMEVDEFNEHLENAQRNSKLDPYKAVILLLD